MADLYVSPTEDVHTSTGNAGSFADPMGLVEALNAASAGDRLIVMGTDEPASPDYEVTSTIAPSSGGTIASPIEIVGANMSGVIDGTRPHIGTTSATSNTGTFDCSSAPYLSWSSLVLGNASNRDVIEGVEGHSFTDVLGLGDGHTSDAFFVDTGTNGDAPVVFSSCEARALGSPSASFHLVRADTGAIAVDCRATDGAGMLEAFTNRMGIVMIGCEAIDTANGIPFRTQLAQAGVSLINCAARGATGTVGFSMGDPSFDTAVASLVGCVAEGNSGDGFSFPNSGAALLEACVAYGNGAYGFDVNSADNRVLARGCSGGNNTSGNLNGSLFSGSITNLAADPFVDSANGDFELDTANASGQALRDLALTMGEGRFSYYPLRSLLKTLPSGGGGGGAVLA